MQVEEIKQGDAKSFRVQIITPTEPLRLDDFESCQMDLAVDEDSFDAPILSLNSSNPSEAIFFDRSEGIVQYFFLDSRTSYFN